MKSPMKPHRKICSIANGRWTAYMAAAAATSFAGTHTAEATIHYSGLIRKKITGEHLARFPLDPGGGSFVAGHNSYVAGSSSFSAGGAGFLYFHGDQSAAVDGIFQVCRNSKICVSNLNRGDAISGRPFATGFGFLAYDFYWNFWYSCGNFQDPGTGFVGFKFNNGAGNQ